MKFGRKALPNIELMLAKAGKENIYENIISSALVNQ